MNYKKFEQSRKILNNLEWEKAMKEMGVSQTISNEELGARKALQQEFGGVY